MRNDVHREKLVIARFTLPPLIRAKFLHDWLDVFDSFVAVKLA